MSDIKWLRPDKQMKLLHCLTVKASDHENANGRYEAQSVLH